MRRRGPGRQLLICAGIGVLIGLVASAVGVGGDAMGFGLVLVIGLAVGVAYLRLRVRYTLPRRSHARMLEMVDDSVGPPPSAQPVTLELADSYARLSSELDRRALAGLMAESFTYSYPQIGRRLTRRMYTRGVGIMRYAFKSQPMTLEDVRAEPASPDVVWVSFSQVCDPYRGPVLDSTWWEKWTLDPAHRELLGAELLGITRVS